MRATSLRGKKRRDAEQDKIKQLLKNRGRQFLDALETLDFRREKMPAERRDCGNATEGRVCANCRPPKPALLVDETVDRLVRIGKFGIGFEDEVYTNFPIGLRVPMVERCGCPFFVVNEFLFQSFISGIAVQYDALKDYRSANSKLAKQLRRSINALRGCLRGKDSVLKIEMLSFAGLVSEDQPICSVLQVVDQLEELLPKVRNAAKYRAGPAGDLIRRSVFLSMAMAWKELTGHLPAKNNADFQDLANAAYVTVVPNGDENYSAEAAAATAIRALKCSKKAPAKRRAFAETWLPRSSVGS
jgi:hypothetical protein